MPPDDSPFSLNQPNGVSADTSTTITDAPSRDARMLMDYLADRDELCPVCKYNLRNLTSCQCPECGWELKLRVTTVEPSQHFWVMVLASLCIASGLGIPCCFFIAYGALQVASEGAGGAFAAFSMLFYAGSIPLTLLVLSKRRAFLRLSREVQQGFAALTVIVTSLMILIDIALIFGGIR